jgi:hypothetical protein
MKITTKKTEVLANESAQRNVIETALKEWAKSRGFTEEITYNSKHDVMCLRREIEIQDYDYICHVMGSPKDMMLGVSLAPLGAILSEEELEAVQKWTLLRNQDMQTGCFSVFDGDIFKLFHFQSINFTGAKHIETVLIENMFTDAVSAYEEYGAEYYKLVEWNETNDSID